MSKHPDLELIRKHALRYIQVTLGCFITCMGFNLFLIPAHLLTGGISGIALIIYYLTGLPVGMQNLVYNLPILYVAYRVFGRLYALDTILGTVALSIILDATHFLVDWQVATDPMLCSIFVSSCPAGPTKASPLRSSSYPGPSPISMSRASGFPWPGTLWWISRQSGQRSHAPIASCSESQLTLIGCLPAASSETRSHSGARKKTC